MLELKIDKILPNLFYEDSNNKSSDISQISILTIKSLIPSIQEVGNRIDYKRFSEELKLWKYYRIGESASLLNILGKIDKDLYFNSKDETIYSRIIPIVLSNKNYEIIEDEIIKNILFTTGNIESLLEWLLLGRALYFMLKNRENLIEGLKEYLINISQVDFLNKYKHLYRVEIDKLPINYRIAFEKVRLDILNLLNGISLNKYIYLEDFLGIIDGKAPKTSFGTIIYKSSKDKNDLSKLNKFYLSMSEYVLRLRKSRINPESLIIKEYILPDIFSYNEGDRFYHSLLKEVVVIKKEVKNGVLTSLIKTKSGMYLLKRDPV